MCIWYFYTGVSINFQTLKDGNLEKNQQGVLTNLCNVVWDEIIWNNIIIISFFGTKILRFGYSYVHDIHVHIFILFTERYRKLQEDYQEAASTVQEQKLLITQLEEDLRSFNAVSSMFRGEAEGEPVTGSQVEADVVAEVVKDVIPSGFCLNLIQVWIVTMK